MDKVFLRVYDHEIENMIEGGHLDEAVAHCLQIIKTFPMHIETYRLLGKAFLEGRRYGDAADIFQRVLMAVPDDFVSHVGMSIIRDDEGNLDDSIWHMERAFEVQPSNAAIQGELRRLYGHRDGVEPSKIRLSRDALANMYSQGELFNQAIAEIRSVLAEDPNRPDLQVMLLRAYYRSGQKVEAAEMAATLLKKYPYCLDALRVLVDVLPGTARTENLEAYRHRLQLLDPYSSFTIDSVFASDQVNDSAVSLERLEYQSGAIPGSPQPNWASSLGIKLNATNRSEPTPEWMQASETTEQPVPIPQEPAMPEVAQVSETAADSIPEWMRSAGWTDSKSGVQAASAGTGNIHIEEDDIAKADIPEWLKSMAPADSLDQSSSEPEESAGPLPVGEDGIPEWLKPPLQVNEPSQMQKGSQEPVKPISTSGEDFPDWLNPTPSPEGTGEKPTESAESIGSGAEMGQDNSTWLQSEEPAEPARDESLPPRASVESQPASSENVPEWLRNLNPSESTGGMASTFKEEQDITEDSSKISGAEPIPSKTPSGVAGTIPDWLTELGDQTSVVPPAFEAFERSATNEQPVPEQPPTEQLAPTQPFNQETSEHVISKPGTAGESLQPAGEVKPLNIGDDALGWLESLAAKQGAKPEELLTSPEARSAEMPDWLRQPGEEAAGVLPTAEEPNQNPPTTMPLAPESLPAEDYVSAGHAFDEAIPVQEETPLGESQSEAVEQPVGQPAGDEEDTKTWLEQLSVEQESKTAEPLVSPESSSESLPTWTQEVSDKQPETPAPEEPVSASSESLLEEDVTITSWLNKKDVEEELARPVTSLPGEVKPGEPSEELPNWLKDLESPSEPTETAKVNDDLPDWLRRPITSAERESTSKPDLPTWIDESVPVSDQAVPTIPEEWIPAETNQGMNLEPSAATEAKPSLETPPVVEPAVTAEPTSSVESAPTVEAAPVFEPAPVVEPVPVSVPKPLKPHSLKQTGMLSKIPAQDKDAELLSNAQNMLDQSTLDEAMKQYTKLIKKGRLLDEVIHDLREALYRYPVDVVVWQTLGDAYMRSNHLQDALDAYTKAEELLR